MTKVPAAKAVYLDPQKPKEPNSLQLKRTVILAYNDIGAISNRAALGIDSRVEAHTLHVPNLKEKKASCVKAQHTEATESEVEAMQILNLKYEDFSIIVINAPITGTSNGEDAHLICSEILKLCSISHIDRMIIAASIHLDVLAKRVKTYENCFFSHHMTALPQLPLNTKIQGRVHKWYRQMVNIENLSLNLFIVPGYNYGFGQAKDDTNAASQIRMIQELITEITGLRFNLGRSLSLVYKDIRDEIPPVETMYL